MSHLLIELQNHILTITLNRVDKNNAFDDSLLMDLHRALEDAEQNDAVRVIVLKGNGAHFSAGADLHWMQRMVNYTEEQNKQDALILAKTMSTLYHCCKPTIAMIHGSTYGGGIGLIAACDIGIATHAAQFCFSEVKLGLIPAVISPYIIKAIGERAATWLFMSAHLFDAQKAQELQLIHHCVDIEELLSYTLSYAQHIAQLPPEAVRDAKSLVRQVSGRPIDAELESLTATLIAQKRVSKEGQRGVQAFLNKEKIIW